MGDNDKIISQLAQGFPDELADDIADAIRGMRTSSYGALLSSTSEVVQVGGDELQLVARVGLTPRSWPSSNTSSRIGLIQACIGSLHFDGYVRQQSIEAVVDNHEPWTIPYVFRLAGDYVLPIVAQLHAASPRIDRANLETYLAQNPRNVRLTASRITSYWNEYYRRESAAHARSTYPGFLLLTALGIDPQHGTAL